MGRDSQVILEGSGVHPLSTDDVVGLIASLLYNVLSNQTGFFGLVSSAGSDVAIRAGGAKQEDYQDQQVPCPFEPVG